MNDDRHADAANGVPISRGSLRQQVTGRLLVGIFQGRLRSGQRLVVQQLADLFRVSPTPVRESLVELASLGLVDLAPNRGAVVRPFGPKEVREISQVRRVLEVEATRCAAGRIEPAAIASLEHELASLHDRAPGPAWDRLVRDLDTRLHGLIARSCGQRPPRRRDQPLPRPLPDASQRLAPPRLRDQLFAIQRPPRAPGDRPSPARGRRRRGGPGDGPAHPLGRAEPRGRCLRWPDPPAGRIGDAAGRGTWGGLRVAGRRARRPAPVWIASGSRETSAIPNY